MATLLLFYLRPRSSQAPVQNGIASLVIFIAGGVVVYGAALYLLDQISGRKFYQAFNWIKSNI
jgi:hypothetical protein